MTDHLEHYGVKGMKWGVRKDRTSSPSQKVFSPDAAAAESTKRKIKTAGISSVSNRELQDFQTRLNLEANVKRLSTAQTKTGQDYMREIGADLLKTGVQRAKQELVAQAFSMALGKSKKR